jgi:hypothetical protein
MQQELMDLQPKLIETSQETEELITIIEKETLEVEEKKKLVEADEAVAQEAADKAKAIKVWRRLLSLFLWVYACCLPIFNSFVHVWFCLLMKICNFGNNPDRYLVELVICEQYSVMQQ